MWGNVRKDFTFEKASSYYAVHSNLSFFFRVAKKRKVLSPAHNRKWDRAARRYVSCCTFLMLVGLLIPMTVWHLSELDFMPLVVSMYLGNFQARTPKNNFAGFKHMLYFLTNCMTSFKTATWLCPSVVFPIISSTYPSRFFPIWWENIMFMSLC